MAAIGWRLEASTVATVFSKGVGFALIAISTSFFSLLFFNQLCMPGGVADRHFRWTGAILGLIRRNVTWATATLVPISFVVALLFRRPQCYLWAGAAKDQPHRPHGRPDRLSRQARASHPRRPEELPHAAPRRLATGYGMSGISASSPSRWGYPYSPFLALSLPPPPSWAPWSSNSG